MRAVDGHLASNIAATTSGFQLDGGMYGVLYTASWGGGSVTLQVLGPDNSTWLVALTAFAADGCINGWLPQGTYRLAVVTSTAVYVRITRVPSE